MTADLIDQDAADRPGRKPLPPHGTRARKTADGCRCDPCTAAHRAYENRRRRKILYGQWSPFVDAEPARRHVRELMAADVGTRTIALRSGLSRSALMALLHGKPGRPPVSKIRPDTAAAILAVRPGTDTVGAGTRVEATGTARRLRALVAIGYPQRFLAAELGMTEVNFGRVILHTAEVVASTERAVRALYERLSMTPGPSGQSRARAVRLGWEPPLAWDDDTIDDPATAAVGSDAAEIARILGGDPDVPLHENGAPRAVTVEAIRRLAADGLIDREIEDRFGGRMSRWAIGNARRRTGIPSGSTRKAPE